MIVMATTHPNQDLRHMLMLSAVCTLARVLPDSQRSVARDELVSLGTDLLGSTRLSDQLDAQLAAELSMLLDALGGFRASCAHAERLTELDGNCS